MTDYDVMVIGGGSAGTSAAEAAAEAGARTLMVNDGELGGLCILRGCMPTKAMLASAHAMHETNQLESLGLRLEGRVVADFPRIMERKSAQVLRFQRAKIEAVEAADYEVRFGRASFAPGGTVEIDGSLVSARSYVIATGSRAWVPPLPGIDTVPVLTSDDVMRLESRPEKLIVLGAGPIGLELALFFARVGTRVLLVNRSPLLCHYDLECGEEMARALQDEPRLELALPSTIERLERSASGLCARIRHGADVRAFEADALLVATGRRADLDGLGLEHVGIEPTLHGLRHDPHMRTDNPHVYVAGDATGKFQILHLANQEGSVAGRNAAAGAPERAVDYRLKMNVIFGDPPFAQVGAGESEALEAGHEVIVGRARFPETGRAITMGVRHGLWKLVADRRSGEILGSSILGPRADDLIHLVAVLMRYHGTVSDALELPWYHPTLSEVMLSLGRDLETQMSGSNHR